MTVTLQVPTLGPEIRDILRPQLRRSISAETIRNRPCQFISFPFLAKILLPFLKRRPPGACDTSGFAMRTIHHLTGCEEAVGYFLQLCLACRQYKGGN